MGLVALAAGADDEPDVGVRPEGHRAAPVAADRRDRDRLPNARLLHGAGEEIDQNRVEQGGPRLPEGAAVVRFSGGELVVELTPMPTRCGGDLGDELRIVRGFMVALSAFFGVLRHFTTHRGRR
jgi:hypothetical protein